MPRANPDVNYEISIHALLAESDARLAAFAQHGAEDFYPRSPCGERRYSLRPPPARGEISIHALLAESDENRTRPSARIYNFYPRSPCGERPTVSVCTPSSSLFLSTLSLRRATFNCGLHFPLHAISIHALLAESDLRHADILQRQGLFLSTLSLRRATPGARLYRFGG